MSGETSGRELTKDSGEIVGEIPFVGAADRYDCQGSRKIARDVDSPAAIGGEIAAGCRFWLYRASFCFQTDCRAYSVSLVVASLFKASHWGCAVYFGRVNDSDIDWMIATGSHKIALNTVLIHSEPVDALYILLGGTMTVSISEDNHNPPVPLHWRAVKQRPSSETVSGRNRGRNTFIDVRLPSATVKALEDSLCCRFPGSN